MKTLPKLPAFKDLFHALWDYDPFPWQTALATQVHAEGHWPGVLALPTAAGKTASLEIAIWHLAASVESASRQAPRRIFFIVDRRVVVDEAFLRAKAIADKLTENHPVLSAVANRLCALGGLPEQPLHAVLLRGGVHRDNHWVRDPAQPVICVSTVDQIGSRLLFRGYGVGEGSRSIHAALTAHDALFLLDEAHLSNPFCQTLSAIKEELTACEPSNGFGLPFKVCRLTATPDDTEGVFRETEADRSHPVLGKRLNTSKPALLVEIACKKPGAKLNAYDRRELEAKNRSALAMRAVELAQRFSESPGLKVIAIILNEVAAARTAFAELQKSQQAAVLFTGRSRPFDRWRLLKDPVPNGAGELGEYLKARPGSVPSEKPLFVVATQCLEAGADFDFDALVTECASLDALRQRFGRLGRTGRELPTCAPAAILARTDLVASGTEHFLYGEALAKTWDWLHQPRVFQKEAHPLLGGRQKGTLVDFGHSALESKLPPKSKLVTLLSPKPDAPLLLDQHLDALARTRPAPLAEPEVSIFLHGAETRPSDVLVVWRADLPIEAAKEDEGIWQRTVNLLRPLSGEALPLPIHSLRNWLLKLSHVDVELTDCEGGRDRSDLSPSRVKLLSPVLRWRGPEAAHLLLMKDDLETIGPGDTLVLPAKAGGCDKFGWNPESAEQVPDIAEPVRLLQRHELWLRVHPAVWQNRKWSTDALIQLLEDTDLSKADLLTKVQSILPTDPGNLAFADQLQQLRDKLADSGPWRKPDVMPALPLSRDCPFVIHTKLTSPSGNPLDIGTLEFPEDDEASRRSPQRLHQHTLAVVDQVSALTDDLNLPRELVEDLALAAAWHDLGKADPRFQFGLNPKFPWFSNPLNSKFLWAKGKEWNEAPEPEDRWPRGARHEALSVELVRVHPLLAKRAHDPELVLHLIASHHGWARPMFAPVVNWSSSMDVRVVHGIETLHPEVEFITGCRSDLYRVDNGISDRFFALQRKYGHYGLAFLEAVLRLADWKASEDAENNEIEVL